MITAIHQPHYFPWLGYMDKMAKADQFIILDEVQLTDRSPMVRNKFLTFCGDVEMLSLSIKKKGYRNKKTKDIELFEIKNVQRCHQKFFECNYRKAAFFNEIMEVIDPIFSRSYCRLIEIQMDTVLLLKTLFGIGTDILYQSNLQYDRRKQKSDLIQAICETVASNVYLSGNGARKYMDVLSFNKAGIRVVYQDFTYPIYQQFRLEKFVPNLSSLDILFQLGIEDARHIFWENVKKGTEFEVIDN